MRDRSHYSCLCSDPSESEDSWARVTGTLKTFGSKRYINAVHIRPVKDHQEIFFHLAEVMSTQLIFDRGPVRTIFACMNLPTLILPLLAWRRWLEPACFCRQRKRRSLRLHSAGAGCDVESILTFACGTAQHHHVHARPAT